MVEEMLSMPLNGNEGCIRSKTVLIGQLKCPLWLMIVGDVLCWLMIGPRRSMVVLGC